MRVFTVTHVLRLDELGVERAWKILAATGYHLTKIISDSAVIGSSVFVGFDGQVKTGLQARATIVGCQLCENHAVVSSVYHDIDMGMVFSGCALHGGSADLTILCRVCSRASFLRDSFFAAVELSHGQINRFDAVLWHFCIIDAAARQDT